MPRAKPTIFISYARKDAATLAHRLQQDIPAAWIDTRDIPIAATWTDEIRKAIHACDICLALLTRGSYTSKICRAEQLCSLRLNKRVIPLLAEVGCPIPDYFQQRTFVDFATSYSKPLKRLLAAIREPSPSTTLPEAYRITYTTAPPLPRDYVERSEALASLRDAVLADGGGPSLAVTALRGMTWNATAWG